MPPKDTSIFLRFFRDLGRSFTSWFCFHVCWCSIADHLQVFADSKQRKWAPVFLTQYWQRGNWEDHWREYNCGFVKLIRIMSSITTRLRGLCSNDIYIVWTQMFKRLCLWRTSNRICVCTAKFALLRYFLLFFSCFSPSSSATPATR